MMNMARFHGISSSVKIFSTPAVVYEMNLGPIGAALSSIAALAVVLMMTIVVESVVMHFLLYGNLGSIFDGRGGKIFKCALIAIGVILTILGIVDVLNLVFHFY